MLNRAKCYHQPRLPPNTQPCVEQKPSNAKKKKKKEAKKRACQGLTAWVTSENISSGFVVQEDEQGVGEGTEPPTWPGGHRERERKGGLQLEM